MTKTKLTAMISLIALLSACGQTPGDRAVSGGAIGAGVGAVGSAVVGGAVLPAAIIGGAVGAAAGGLSSPSTVDLGKPIWR